MPVRPTLVLMMASVMKSRMDLSAIALLVGLDPPVQLTLMNVSLTLVRVEESVKTSLMALSAFVLHSGLEPPVSWILMNAGASVKMEAFARTR